MEEHYFNEGDTCITKASIYITFICPAKVIVKCMGQNPGIMIFGIMIFPRGDGGGVLGSGFAGYVPLASQNPHPIIVYSVANYRPHLSHFWANVIVISRTEFIVSQMLNIKTTAGTIFQRQIFLILNPCFPEFSYPKNPENFATPF